MSTKIIKLQSSRYRMVINLEHDSTSVACILDSFVFMRLNVKFQNGVLSSESKYYRTSIDGRGIMHICVL